MNRAEVAAKLQEAANGVFMLSESEFPFEGVHWQATRGDLTPQQSLDEVRCQAKNCLTAN